MTSRSFLGGVLAGLAGLCFYTVTVFAQSDPLPSWNDGASKQAIVEFVEAVTEDGGQDYVAPRDRIATFDNDGTLWVEHPMYTQLAFALDRVKARLAEAGARLVATAPPDMALVNALAHLVLSVEASSRLGPDFAARGSAIGRQVRDRLEPGLAYPATLYANALRLRRPVRENWLAACLGDADLALIPAIPREVPTIAETTAPRPAAPNPADDPEAVAAVIGHVTRATRGINYLGLPALVAPCGQDDAGLPIAFQLVGRPFDEARLIAVADAFQRHDDTHTRRPPLAR